MPTEYWWQLASVRQCEHVCLKERSVTGHPKALMPLTQMRTVWYCAVCQDDGSSLPVTPRNFVNKQFKPTTTASCRPAVERVALPGKPAHPGNLAAKDADTPIPRVRSPSNATGGTTCTRKLVVRQAGRQAPSPRGPGPPTRDAVPLLQSVKPDGAAPRLVRLPP